MAESEFEQQRELRLAANRAKLLELEIRPIPTSAHGGSRPRAPGAKRQRKRGEAEVRVRSCRLP